MNLGKLSDVVQMEGPQKTLGFNESDRYEGT